jgi:hypothetical protein
VLPIDGKAAPLPYMVETVAGSRLRIFGLLKCMSGGETEGVAKALWDFR